MLLEIIKIFYKNSKDVGVTQKGTETSKGCYTVEH